ncbi:MAG TPA: 2-amino-4-hydroxy-6-hydroxymethyldihydropteridine diphosphokinase [Longimicrobiaceae bacterium]|nr:2-amino-4-hydroxy-6-hydroxymethyldihydropteridine diphosphokinase [Longimicrobiaceae bacterium]
MSAPADVEVLIGLGSNQDDPVRRLAEAVGRLAPVVRVAATSPVYLSEPVGFREQPDFYNLVVRGLTGLAPEALLAHLQAVERAMGRRREFRDAPRVIDLDLLAYGDRVVEAPGLTVPHPRMTGRAFVLVPLAEVAPEWRHPRLGQTARELLAAAGTLERIERWGELPSAAHGRRPPASRGRMEQEYTVGVEEEYQLVDGESGELKSRARFVIDWDWSGEIKPEMQENTVEVETRICAETACVRDELARLRFQAAVAAEARGLRVVAAGTHPFSGWEEQEFSPGEVYRKLRQEYRRLASTQNIFGMHVHVSVPEGTDRVATMNVARHFLPHLLALTASSPLYLGEDTGYASYRSILWRRWPRTGAPPRFADGAEFERLIGLLMETGCIDAPGRVYWDVRPHHQYPTLEYRVADVTPRVEDAVAAAALARAVTAGAVEGVLREPELPDAVLGPLLRENAWRASRDGLGAELVVVEDERVEVVPAREALLRLAERLAPVAERLGDGDVLAGLPAVLERGDAAARIRARAEQAGGDLRQVVRWLADETVLGVGLDRRTEQREVLVE